MSYSQHLVATALVLLVISIHHSLDVFMKERWVIVQFFKKKCLLSENSWFMNQRGYDNDSEKKNQKIWANLETFLYKLSFLASEYTLSNLKIAHVEPISSRISGSSTFDWVQLFRRVVLNSHDDLNCQRQSQSLIFQSPTSWDNSSCFDSNFF